MSPQTTSSATTSHDLDLPLQPMPSSSTPSGPKKKMTWAETWEDSKGMVLVLLSEAFGTGMATAARLLETESRTAGTGLDIMQIIFVRFGITLILSALYCWYTQVPDFPCGKAEVRWLLVLRGVGGLFGVYGFYYSLAYLPVAESIFLFFITPLLTAYSCSIFLHEPFVIKQLYAGIISLAGIVLIAHPASLFGSDSPSSSANSARGVPEPIDVTPVQRLIAIIVGFASTFAATCAYTTIRVIGPRAHPLISVNYYGLISVGVSFLLLASPSSIYSSTFQLPANRYERSLLILLGTCGFGLQFLMTAGLVKDTSSRATSMMYSSVVFGLAADYLVWNVVPGTWSAVGGAIVVGATIWGALQKPSSGEEKGRGRDEEYAMVGGESGAFVLEDEGDESDGVVYDSDDGEGEEEEEGQKRQMKGEY